MKVLAIDTCVGTCSVSVISDKTVLSEKKEERPHKQAERLLPLIEEALQDAKTVYEEMDLIAVTIGPGSFTGARIGLAASKGISLVSGKKLRGISTLQASAFKARSDLSPKQKKILVLHDARRGQVYAQTFFNNAELEAEDEARLINIAKIAAYIGKDNFIVTNFDAILLENNSTKINKISYSASDVGLLAQIIISGTEENISPLYIRPPDAKMPKNKHA